MDNGDSGKGNHFSRMCGGLEMKVSSKGRYGLRIMLELALKYGAGPVMMSSIENTQGISRKYMHTLLTSLKTVGLVKSIRGAGGGFILAFPPSEIFLDEVIEALEGPFDITECAKSDAFCSKADNCVTREIWRDVGQAVKDVLSKTTLGQLASRQKSKSSQSVMFYI
jgi:Rrf2 family transcriptional regulator, cysteine metabolism repressor